ncbi:MAG: pantoate--beta-alanine ligase, partial [Elusimicrobia bacterium]|nr:pantoate--beta-alanine ligase [Elusimicrobiota bacterium]
RSRRRPCRSRGAPKFPEGLRAGAAAAVRRGAKPKDVLAAAKRVIAGIPGVKIDYLRLVDADTLADAERLRGELRLLGAIRLGRTRLIDNLPVICPK